jgi:rhodanese-related sulfurtransferase
MNHRLTMICMTLLTLHLPASAIAAESEFEAFLSRFDYETRADMKVDSKRLLQLLSEKKAVLVDIRFKEETQAWKMGFGLFIPLNELPHRLNELPRDKIIVAACPHKDRSAIAMAYLRSKGYNARYLTDGLTGLAENLRGDSAKEFMDEIAPAKTKQR